MLQIKVLGSGCSNCKQVEAAVRKTLEGMGAEADVVKITDYAEIMSYGVLATPGLVIDGKLVSSGRIPGAAELSAWVADALAAA